MNKYSNENLRNDFCIICVCYELYFTTCQRRVHEIRSLNDILLAENDDPRSPRMNSEIHHP